MKRRFINETAEATVKLNVRRFTFKTTGRGKMPRKKNTGFDESHFYCKRQRTDSVSCDWHRPTSGINGITRDKYIAHLNSRHLNAFNSRDDGEGGNRNERSRIGKEMIVNFVDNFCPYNFPDPERTFRDVASTDVLDHFYCKRQRAENLSCNWHCPALGINGITRDKYIAHLNSRHLNAFNNLVKGEGGNYSERSAKGKEMIVNFVDNFCPYKFLGPEVTLNGAPTDAMSVVQRTVSLGETNDAPTDAMSVVQQTVSSSALGGMNDAPTDAMSVVQQTVSSSALGETNDAPNDANEQNENYEPAYSDASGQFAREDPIESIRTIYDSAGNTAQLMKWIQAPEFVHAQILDFKSIRERYWNQVSEKRRSSFMFYCAVMHTSLDKAANSQLQAAIDTEYWYEVSRNKVDIETLTGRLKNAILTKQKVFGRFTPKDNIDWLPWHSRSLYFSTRKTMYECFGDFLKLYRTKINIPGTEISHFYFVNPIPLALLNLHSHSMLKNVKRFTAENNNRNTPLYFNDSSSFIRTRCRLGSTSENIIKEHYKRAEENPLYKNSSPLLVRIFLDGALVGWDGTSQTPIIMTIGNLHPDLQVQAASKTLIGYYPDCELDERLPKAALPKKNQQIWHKVIGEITSCFDRYHKGGGITMQYPSVYENQTNSKFITRTFMPYITCIGKKLALLYSSYSTIAYRYRRA